MFDTSDPIAKETFNRLNALEFAFRALVERLEARLPGLSAEARDQVEKDYVDIRAGVTSQAIARRRHLASELLVPWHQRPGSPVRPDGLGAEWADGDAQA